MHKYSWREIVRRLWVELRGNRVQTSLNALIGLLTVLVSLASVWAVQRAIDIATGDGSGILAWAIVVMALLIVAEFALGICRVWIRNILGVKAQNRMQREMLDRLLRAEWNGRERHHSGDVINRLELDVRTVTTFVTETLPSTVSTIAMFIGAFVYLCVMDYRLALIVVGILPFFILLSRFYVNKMRKYNRRVRNLDSRVQSVLQESVQNRMLIKTLEADDTILGRLGTTQDTLHSHIRRRTKFSLVSHLLLSLGFSAGYLVAFTWCVFGLYHQAITFGMMTAFLQLVHRIQTPTRELTRLAPAFVAVFTAMERLAELENLPEEEQGEDVVMPSPCGVRLTDVHFVYDDGNEKIIDNLSFDFAPATCTAILGETGAGKTTLIRLLLGLIKPTAGSIELYAQRSGEDDSCEGNDANAPATTTVSPATRCNFVYVPQGNTLLSGSIRDNLRMAQPQATEADMTAALTMACAEFVFTLPHGLDTKTDEEGGGLSEGQAQRIAIARALLRNRAVMLFDEATSALDPDTEKRLLQNILSDKTRTIIFITHRPAVLDYCDANLQL